MPILNGFYRGAYDKEIITNIDQKEFAGVATEMYNFVGTKRGGLSKRASFKYQMGVNNDTYFIPYVYDQDQNYLLVFNGGEDGKAKFRMLQYTNSGLEFATIGAEAAVIQPLFESNEQEGFVCSQSETIGGYNAYEIINSARQINKNTLQKYSVVLKFPTKITLSELEITNKRHYTKTVVNPAPGKLNQGGYITQYFYNTVSFVVEGSLDGITWQKINQDKTQGSTEFSQMNKTFVYFSDPALYQYLRVRVTGLDQKIADSAYSPDLFALGGIRYKVRQVDESLTLDTPYTMQEITELHHTNENKRMIFFHKDHKPQEFSGELSELVTTGLDTEYGNPRFGCFYQSRLGLGGFGAEERRFVLSKPNPKNNQSFNFTQTSPLTAESPIDVVIRDAKYPLKEVLSGRNMIYLQCIDGLATISSGGDEVPLTATQISAGLRNRTPFSDIPAIFIEETAYLVGSDYKTVYAMDYDFNVMRVRTLPVNEHCLTYFESGIAQMVSMKGKLPYIVFRLNNGKLLAATSYRTTNGFAFHLYPIRLADGTAQCIGTLMNQSTGYDTLFAVIKHSNNVYTLESIESSQDIFATANDEEYTINNIGLDFQYEFEVPKEEQVTFTYNGTTSETGRVLFAKTSDVDLDLPDNEIKLLFLKDNQEIEILCKDCRFDSDGMWAEVSAIPPLDSSIGYKIPSSVVNMAMYKGLQVVVFDEEDILAKVSEDDDGNITFNRPIYKGKCGLIYTAYAQFDNITGADVAGYEKTVTSISACITYGTGLKIGTESGVEKIGSSVYPYTEWQDKILKDESMRNIPLADKPRKDKKIVLESDYPLPANITFITYDIKITGVK